MRPKYDQPVGWWHDPYRLMDPEGQKVAVSGNDDVRLGRDGGSDHMVVVGIVLDHPGRREGRYDVDCFHVVRHRLMGALPDESEPLRRPRAEQNVR